MFKLLLLCSIVLAVSAQYYDPYAEIPQPYNFAYGADTEDGGGLSQQEVGDERGGKRGSYSYRSPDGVLRTVEYIADELGFRAVVHTNEPGTANQHPADVQVNSDSPVQPSIDYNQGHHGNGYY